MIAGKIGLPPAPSARTRARLGHPVAPQASQQRVRLHAGSSLRSFVATLWSACRIASLARFFRFRGLRSGSFRGRAAQALRSHSLRGL